MFTSTGFQVFPHTNCNRQQAVATVECLLSQSNPVSMKAKSEGKQQVFDDKLCKLQSSDKLLLLSAFDNCTLSLAEAQKHLMRVLMFFNGILLTN